MSLALFLISGAKVEDLSRALHFVIDVQKAENSGVAVTRFEHKDLITLGEANLEICAQSNLSIYSVI